MPEQWMAVAMEAAAATTDGATVYRTLRAQGCSYAEARSLVARLRATAAISRVTSYGTFCDAGQTFLHKDVPPLGDKVLAKQSAWLVQAKANVLHLLDLKRAGHSPRRTELCIPNEAEVIAPRPRPLSSRSHIGSAAALMVEA